MKANMEKTFYILHRKILTHGSMPHSTMAEQCLTLSSQSPVMPWHRPGVKGSVGPGVMFLMRILMESLPPYLTAILQNTHALVPLSSLIKILWACLRKSSQQRTKKWGFIFPKEEPMWCIEEGSLYHIYRTQDRGSLSLFSWSLESLVWSLQKGLKWMIHHRPTLVVIHLVYLILNIPPGHARHSHKWTSKADEKGRVLNKGLFQTLCIYKKWEMSVWLSRTGSVWMQQLTWCLISYRGSRILAESFPTFPLCKSNE